MNRIKFRHILSHKTAEGLSSCLERVFWHFVAANILLMTKLLRYVKNSLKTLDFGLQLTFDNRIPYRSLFMSLQMEKFLSITISLFQKVSIIIKEFLLKHISKIFFSLFADNDMSAFPEHLVLGNKLKVTPAVSKFLLNFPFKKLNTSSNS